MTDRKAIEALKGEVRKGATYCALLALRVFTEETKNPVEVARELIAIKPQMAPIVHIATSCFDHFEAQGTNEEWLEKCAVMKSEMESAPKKIAKWLTTQPETGKHVMTASYSDTVFEALCEVAKERTLEVATTEGRPLCEGALLAKRLSYANIPVKLGVDAAAYTLLEECDAVWIGADAIGSEFFVNKIGTRALVLGAKVMQKPVFVLADPLKMWPKGRKWQDHDHGADEVLANAEPPLFIVNPYFEKIPLDWVTLVMPPLVLCNKSF